MKWGLKNRILRVFRMKFCTHILKPNLSTKEATPTKLEIEQGLYVFFSPSTCVFIFPIHFLQSCYGGANCKFAFQISDIWGQQLTLEPDRNTWQGHLKRCKNINTPTAQKTNNQQQFNPVHFQHGEIKTGNGIGGGGRMRNSRRSRVWDDPLFRSLMISGYPLYLIK